MRPESVEHEFVNVRANLTELRNPKITDELYLRDSPGSRALEEILLGLIHDWGAGLDTDLYGDAVIHFLGGESAVLSQVPVNGTGGELALQKMRLVEPDAAFRLTAFSPESSRLNNFRIHAQRS